MPKTTKKQVILGRAQLQVLRQMLRMRLTALFSKIMIKYRHDATIGDVQLAQAMNRQVDEYIGLDSTLLNADRHMQIDGADAVLLSLHPAAHEALLEAVNEIQPQRAVTPDANDDMRAALDVLSREKLNILKAMEGPQPFNPEAIKTEGEQRAAATIDQAVAQRRGRLN
jgi:hypothetical protein